jgi:hypothetical protein
MCEPGFTFSVCLEVGLDILAGLFELADSSCLELLCFAVEHRAYFLVQLSVAQLQIFYLLLELADLVVTLLHRSQQLKRLFLALLQLLVPYIDAPDVLVVLEAQFIQRTSQIGELSARGLLQLLQLEAYSVALGIRVDSPLGLEF